MLSSKKQASTGASYACRSGQQAYRTMHLSGDGLSLDFPMSKGHRGNVVAIHKQGHNRQEPNELFPRTSGTGEYEVRQRPRQLRFIVGRQRPRLTLSGKELDIL